MLLDIFFSSGNSALYLANSGVPLFTQSVVYQVLLLIPIIVIEAYIHRKLLKINTAKATWLALSTNLISTLVGGLLVMLPLGVFIGSVLLGSSVPVQPGSFPLLPLELIVTLILMFLFSVFLEAIAGSFILRRIK